MEATSTVARPIMTAAELKAHYVGANGRNYAESDDGYSDMAAEAGRGWSNVSSWGADGWDLGDWPYVSFQVKHEGASFLLQQIVEGDRSRWAFDSRDDLYAAIDYLFLWYAAGESWAPLTYEQRNALNAGTLRIPEQFRGPYAPAGSR